MAKRETTRAGKTPSETPSTMQGRNGGTLRRGGTNRGGPGRPTNEARRRSRECYDRFLDWAEEYMDSAEAEPSIMVQLGKVAAGVGVPKQSEVKHTGLFALAARLEGMSEKELRVLLADKEGSARLLREVNTDGE